MEGVPLIDDINETTASITLDYQVSAQDDEGKTEIYDVTEFYRMRYTETRIMLLDFKRSATKVFDPSQKVVSDAGLLLGVRDKNVTYASDSSGKIVAFEQDGDLWSYASSSGKITRIFSSAKRKITIPDMCATNMISRSSEWQITGMWTLYCTVI